MAGIQPGWSIRKGKGSDGHRPEFELDRLSNILKTFNDQFGTIPWTDGDHVHRLITEDIPNRVAADRAYQNAKLSELRQAERADRARQGARTGDDGVAEGRHGVVQATQRQ